ncbi:cellulose biosynthesis protein BcsO [Enterobacter sp.]|uniref:cellulose biosynthesis protein BcsO n=1 Tax=Enterobacter sp. TaxID=42895 RepID=UPI00296FE4F4|nr:cellulose biosynthesis protein BcsO [Enterobacter sp.]
MNHYDDLQRFKDKTRTQHLDFKDLSSQNQGSEQGNWAIINQLSPATEESTLAMGGHVSAAIPQAVNPEIFAVNPTTPPADAMTHASPESAPVTTSLFQDVASQLSVPPQPEAAPAPAITPAAPPPAPEPVAIAPAPQRSVTPAPAAAPVNFAQLFAPKITETKPAAEKNQPLKSLLERIASCR